MKILHLLILLAPFVLFSGVAYVTASNDVDPTWTYYTDGPVNSIAVSSDGTHFVSGSKSVDGGTIYYFDNQGTVIWQSTQDRQILSVAISDDGSYVAAAGSQFYHYGTYGPAGYNKGMVYFFDKTGNLLWKYDTNDNAALQVSVTFDGSHVVVDTSGGILYLNKDGKLLWSHNDSSINDHPVKITKDGSLIATKDNQKLLVFEKNGTLLWEKTEDNWGAFAFSDDGRFLATSADPSGIDLLDRNGKLIWKDSVGMHFLSTSLSENGSYIATSAQQWGQDNPGGLFLIDDNARVLWQRPGDGYSAISSDGSFIAMGLWTQDNPSVLLYGRDGNLLWQHVSGLVHSIAISYDGKYVIAGIGDSNYGDGSVQLFTNEQTLSELNTTARTQNENPPVIITQVELNSPYKPIPQDISCVQWNELADKKLVPYFCTENVVPKEAVECGYSLMSPHACNPVHETYNFTDACPFHSGFLPNGTPIVEKYAKGDQWITIYNTQDKPVNISNFNMKWNSTGFYENYDANFSLTLSPHEQCSLVSNFVESTTGTALIQYEYQGNNYVFKTPQLADGYHDLRVWQFDGNKWVFDQQNMLKVPEFDTLAIPVLIMGIILVMTFYRMRFGK